MRTTSLLLSLAILISILWGSNAD